METCHLGKSPWNMEILKDQVERLKNKLKNRKISQYREGEEEIFQAKATT